MKLLAVEPVPAALASALETLAAQELESSCIPAGELPPLGQLSEECDLLVLPATGFEELLTAIRQHSALGAMLVAVIGADDERGALALAGGADLLLDPGESASLIAARLDALVRRGLLGGAPRLDALTGMISRSLFVKLLDHEFERAKRYRRVVTILAIEPDGLDELQREHGVREISRTIVKLSPIVRETVRDVDLLTRFSESRFVMALPETAPDGAHAAAERLRERRELGQLRPAAKGNSKLRRLTLSIGLAAFPARGMETPPDLLGRALEALLHARKSGGDQVVAFGAPGVVWSRDAPDPSGM